MKGRCLNISEFVVFLLWRTLWEWQVATDGFSSIPNLHFLCRVYPLNAYYISINMHLYIVSDSRIHAELEKASGRKRCGVESHGPMRSQAQ